MYFLHELAFSQISLQERSMAGAPEGVLFEAKLLETSDLPVSSDVAKDLEVSVWVDRDVVVPLFSLLWVSMWLLRSCLQ